MSLTLNKTKAFTLIELLVVVAIIGILAAVGVVAYNGYTSAAKKAAAKSNHASVLKYAAAELMKCQLGEEYIMVDQFGNRLRCYQRTWPGYATAGITRALIDFKNPYGSPYSAVTSNKNTLGFNKVTDDGTKVTVVTCWDDPCTGTNVMTDTVPIE
jgi:type IV pilus assembly protein PilA